MQRNAGQVVMLILATALVGAPMSRTPARGQTPPPGRRTSPTLPVQPQIRRTLPPRANAGRDATLRRVQDEPPLPALPTPPAAAPGVDASQVGEEPVDLGVPAADRPTGGEPTAETAATEAEEATAAEEPKRLQDVLGFEESPIKIYGWIQNSFTGNTNGKPPSGENFGVTPNHRANEWMGNQFYIILEDLIEQEDEINFGWRIDNLLGHDWQFNYMQGLFNNVFTVNHLGYDMAQFYGEVHLPILTEGGLDIRGGRFYTLAGYEQVPAIARPLLSVPYMFTFGQPFTHFGAMTTLHVTDKINLHNCVVNGWDRFIDQRYIWNYMGGITWTGNEDKTTLAIVGITGPNQFPSFLPANQQIFPTGYINIPSAAGADNPFYHSGTRSLITTVVTHKWTDKLTQVVETDQGWEFKIPGLASGGANIAPANATWYSFGNWFLYQFTPKLTGVWRSEIFWDTTGVRTGTLQGDRYHEMTLGAIYKPCPNIWIRPEARYDWAQFHTPYNDGTRGSQLTLAFDVIVLF